MTDEPKIKVVKVPMLDTGIGREAGYANDQEFIEAEKAKREKMSPEARDLLEKIDREYERRFLFGS